MRSARILLLAIGLLFALSGFAQAVPVVDVIQAPTGFFVPTDAQKYDSPYYRWYNQDWGWTHNPIAGAAAPANLLISAFDVDRTSSDPQIDNIYAYDSGSWTLLGALAGANDIWSYTTFALGASFFDDIAAGLQVKMDIDTGHTYDYWAVTLAKSVLTVEGGTPPPPEPGIPEPATLITWSLLGGLGIAVGWWRRKRAR